MLTILPFEALQAVGKLTASPDSHLYFSLFCLISHSNIGIGWKSPVEFRVRLNLAKLYAHAASEERQQHILGIAINMRCHKRIRSEREGNGEKDVPVRPARNSRRTGTYGVRMLLLQPLVGVDYTPGVIAAYVGVLEAPMLIMVVAGSHDDMLILVSWRHQRLCI